MGALARLPVLEGCLQVVSGEERKNILAVMLHLVLDVYFALHTVLSSGQLQANDPYSIRRVHCPMRETNR